MFIDSIKSPEMLTGKFLRLFKVIIRNSDRSSRNVYTVTWTLVLIFLFLHTFRSISCNFFNVCCTHIKGSTENFQKFMNEYITRLNRSYTPINSINRDLIREETVRLYKQLSDSLGVHRPPHDAPRVKTMMFTPFISMVGVTGSMGPFFCEFTLNGDLLPVNYPATYAHELAHLLGITSEAEANFYAYQVCTRSQAMGIRFSGYFSVLNHVLGNAQRLLPKEEYAKLLKRIRPEIIELAKANQTYWAAKYSPVVGAVQDWIYDLYLKGNKIESGRRNYSEVIGLLISYQEWKNR